MIVGMAGFEPAASDPPDRRHNQARPHPVSFCVSSVFDSDEAWGCTSLGERSDCVARLERRSLRPCVSFLEPTQRSG